MPDRPEIGVALLRGINVGGRNRLPMADLRAVLTGLGLDRISTHIQSGNAVFGAPAELNGLADRIAAAIEGQAGFRPAVLVLHRDSVAEILAQNPFATEGKAGGNTVHIGFLAEPTVTDAARLNALAAPDERFHLTDRAFYLHAPSGIGRSKLAAGAEKALGVAMTLRNQRVAQAVADLAAEADA